MKKDIADILLSIGIPAGVKGFTYICDAMEIFDTDPYYSDGKICALYHEIAHKRDTTASRVERAMRHAFETAITKGNLENVEKYLDLVNTQNSNLLRTLYIRIKQDEKQTINVESAYDIDLDEMKQQLLREMMMHFYKELGLALEKMSVAKA